MSRRATAALLLALAIPACDTVGPGLEDRRVGIILGLADGDPAVTMPDTVDVGQTFTVGITTVWKNSCVRGDGTEVREEGLLVQLTPFDVITTNTVCLQEPASVDHTAELTFSQAGTATVRIRGRATEEGALMSVEDSVHVR